MRISEVICSKCGNVITPEEDRYIFTFKHRNKQVEKSWMWKAYTQKTLNQFHKRCYKK